MGALCSPPEPLAAHGEAKAGLRSADTASHQAANVTNVTETTWNKGAIFSVCEQKICLHTIAHLSVFVSVSLHLSEV